MTLWFENSEGQERVIAQVNTWQEVYKAIDDFIEQCNQDTIQRYKDFYGENYDESKVRLFKSYYSRTWKEGDRTKIDVGSWTEFFYTDLPYEEVKDEV